MRNTRNLFKKIGNIKRTFHARMGMIKDRNGKDLTEAEDMKKQWQEYTEELYSNNLNDLDKHDGVATHLEPDILEYEVTWALRSITNNNASGGDGIPAELFQILKDDAVEVLHSVCQQIWKTQQWPQDQKGSVFIPIPKKGNAKECSNYHTIMLISHASKIMLKILQARLQYYVIKNFQMYKLNLGKAEESKIKLPTSLGSQKKQENSSKHLLLLHYPKVFDCVDHHKLWTVLKEMGLSDHITSLLRNLYTGQE